METNLRVGIIGTGRAGRSHATAFLKQPHVSVTGLWNRTRSRAEELATSLGQSDVQVYGDWRDLIERGEVDIISITAAPIVRSQPFAEALSRGRHVLVEKPLSLDLEEAREMAALAWQAKTVTAISFNWRYSPGCQTAWRALREGQIGRLLDVRTEWRMRCSPLWSSAPSWSEMSGSLREAGSHEFDRVRFLTGWDFRRVVSSIKLARKLPTGSHKPAKPSDVFASALAEMSDEGQGAFRLSITPGQPERQISICGEKGTLVLSSDWVVFRPSGQERPAVTLSSELRVLRQRVDDADPVTLEIADQDQQSPGTPSGQHTWNRLIADFVRAVRSSDLEHASAEHLPHISDGLAVQEVIVACEQSHAEERWVELK